MDMISDFEEDNQSWTDHMPIIVPVNADLSRKDKEDLPLLPRLKQDDESSKKFKKNRQIKAGPLFLEDKLMVESLKNILKEIDADEFVAQTKYTAIKPLFILLVGGKEQATSSVKKNKSGNC